MTAFLVGLDMRYYIRSESTFRVCTSNCDTEVGDPCSDYVPQINYLKSVSPPLNRVEIEPFFIGPYYASRCVFVKQRWTFSISYIDLNRWKTMIGLHNLTGHLLEV